MSDADINYVILIMLCMYKDYYDMIIIDVIIWNRLDLFSSKLFPMY